MKKFLSLTAVLSCLSVFLTLPAAYADFLNLQTTDLRQEYWYLPGAQVSGDSTGASLDAFYGPFAVLSLDDGYILAELAVPAGLGTRFGDINSDEGGKATIHIGAALCGLDRSVCFSGTYNTLLDDILEPDQEEWRTGVNVDLTRLPAAMAFGLSKTYHALGGK